MNAEGSRQKAKDQEGGVFCLLPTALCLLHGARLPSHCKGLPLKSANRFDVVRLREQVDRLHLDEPIASIDEPASVSRQGRRVARDVRKGAGRPRDERIEHAWIDARTGWVGDGNVDLRLETREDLFDRPLVQLDVCEIDRICTRVLDGAGAGFDFDYACDPGGKEQTKGSDAAKRIEQGIGRLRGEIRHDQIDQTFRHRGIDLEK